MNINSFKSGKYEQRLEYRAFVPELICHEWDIADAELTDLLGRADRALGELNAYSQLIPDIDFVIRAYVAKEAAQSSRIEGTQTNIEDAFKDANDLKPEERDDWAEVQNYIHAINFAIGSLHKLPLSNRLLCETHAVLMAGVRGKHKQPGEFRVSQNWIGVSLRNAAFVPPHNEHVPELMGDLEKLLHTADFFVHPLVRIAIAHYQFETIHPFLDGNGRLGRLMISLYLAATGLLGKPALYLSDYFERNKTAYMDHLMAVREGNHLREWLVFFLHGVEETAHGSASVFRAILEIKHRIEGEVLPRFSVARLEKARALIRSLYAQPFVNVRRAAKIIGGTVNTASSLITELVTQNVLVEVTGRQRDRLFAFHQYLALFRK
ncbi:MAG: Fic family protein [Verrucomicrobiota bacterium]|nr:Fic family protein [Verrucomicrobiota bacterium]